MARTPESRADVEALAEYLFAGAAPRLIVALCSCSMSEFTPSPPVSLSMKALTWLSGTAPWKPSTGLPSTKA